MVALLNEATRFVAPEPGSVQRSFEELFLTHYGELQRVASPLGWMIAVIDPAGGVRSVTSTRDAFVTVGRHTHVDLQLPADPGVALRHLVLRCRGGAVRLVDLNTSTGVEVDGVGWCEALTCDGDLFIRVGSYAVMCFPPSQAWLPGEAAAAWRARPSRRISDRRALDLFPDLRARSQETTSIVLRAGARPLESGAGEGGAAAVLEIETRRGWERHPLSAAHLDRGVLLGRYARCHVDGYRFPLCESVSRVHLLLLREADEIFMVDAGSTYGTWVEGTLVRSAVVRSRVPFELAPGNRARVILPGASELD